MSIRMYKHVHVYRDIATYNIQTTSCTGIELYIACTYIYIYMYICIMQLYLYHIYIYIYTYYAYRTISQLLEACLAADFDIQKFQTQIVLRQRFCGTPSCVGIAPLMSKISQDFNLQNPGLLHGQRPYEPRAYSTTLLVVPC